ncbi:winged helix-turn-helix transcriptional regulator [Lacticaseibacillus parakribbianus]|uniref:winged helix-turn-helix transcriptional regulator n=1 Tax=Lacticaseibacillus parakribbianus TaxID=2970927 RepID=UPI0021CB02D4|nr:helix-turn-helix domain-containing protein [Lacticaseibacillus parakribbianus]
MSKIYRLGIEATLAVIGGKWKPVILCHLGGGPRRPSFLLANIPGLTQKMLTQQLRELERDGIVSRTVYPQVPPKVEYALTERGKSLRTVLVAMSAWGESAIAARAAAGEDVTLLHPEHDGFLLF